MKGFNIAMNHIKRKMKSILDVGKYKFWSFLAIITFLLVPISDIFAQPPPPPPPNIPIDGGIGWLIVAGVAYGVKKNWDFGKKR